MRLPMALIVFAAAITASGAISTVFANVLKNASLELTPKCERQFAEFFANLSVDPNSWALQMIDATSKLPSGLLSMDFGEMGNFQQCIDVDAGDILGKYCLGYISFGDNVSTPSNLPQAPAWALCLPSGCTTDDANVVGNTLFESVLGLGVDFSEMLCQTTHEVNPKLTPAAITTIVIISLLVLTVFLATMYDIYCTFYGHRICPVMIRGFSAYTNSSKIFKTVTSTPDQLPCLNGLKCISMIWVVAGHQYSVPAYGSFTNFKDLLAYTDQLSSMLIVGGSLSVDTFFTIGGALMAYGFMKSKHKKIPFNLFLYYLHRYLRLTAPFALVVLVSATLLQYMGSGPKWPYMKLYFQENCVDYWWSALLYVQNYVNITKMCVGQTWYLNVDFQLYLISPLIFYFLWKYPKIASPVLGFGVVVFVAVSFYLAWCYQLPAILSNFNGNSLDYQNKYYLLTHARPAPWIVGVLLGYFLFKIKNNKLMFKLNNLLVLTLWVVCLGSMLACVLAGHSTLRGVQYDKWGNAFHIALVRPVWSVAIAWIIFACTNNYGGPINWVLSLPIYQVLNRFTYSVYLTHVTLLYVIAYGRQWPDYFSVFNMAYQFWGTLWFSTGLAYLLILTTESPIIVIEKLLLSRFVCWFLILGDTSWILGCFAPKTNATKGDAEMGVDNAAFDK